MQEILIPKERVAVLVGEKGSTLKEVKKLTQLKIKVVDDGYVTIEGDPVEEYRGAQIIKAIGRGFSPEKALKLLEDNTMLCIIDVLDYASTDKAKVRLKGRVIGKDGRIRSRIEKETNTVLAVYGKTISVIGRAGAADITRQAVEMLLEGRSHTTIFGFLRRHQEQLI